MNNMDAPISTSDPVKSANSGEQIATVTPSVPDVVAEPQPTLLKIEDGSDMLDFLMQHVESETSARPATAQDGVPEASIAPVGTKEEQPVQQDAEMTEDNSVTGESVPVQHGGEKLLDSYIQAQVEPPISSTALIPDVVQDQPAILPPGLEPASTATVEHLRAVAEVNGLPPTSDTLVSDHILPATDGNLDAPAEKEWETDSSPYSSSTDTSTDSSDSSDEDDSDDADDYTLLDPYEQARILMAEDGGAGDVSDDDENPSSTRARPTGGAGLRSTNEKPEEVLPKPNITITESMHVEELGNVEAIVENTLLIRAKVSGEYQVLESGSLLCLPDRTIIGVVAEPLGRVEEPLYTVRFASAADIQESGVSERGTKVCYVREHSSFVFTQPLKAVKGSDASNFHDEEVGDDEMEFSDDEKEAEYKRNMKLRRKGIDPDSVPSGGRGRGRGRDRGSRGGRGGSVRGGYNSGYMNSIPETNGSAYDNGAGTGAGEVEMNYDDVEEGETDYTPLKRPGVMTAGGPISPIQPSQTHPLLAPQHTTYQNTTNRNTFNQNQNQNQSRGRGRGRGGNNNNPRGRGRGGQSNYNRNGYNNNTTPYTPNTTSNTNTYTNPTSPPYNNNQQQQQYYPPTQQAQYPTYPFQQPSQPFSAGSILPLPLPTSNSNTPFTYPTYPTFPAFPSFPNMSQWPQHQQPQQQSHQHSQYQQQPQQQQNYANNADAIAQVQRQLEELRRSGAGAGNGNAGAGAGGQLY